MHEFNEINREVRGGGGGEDFSVSDLCIRHTVKRCNNSCMIPASATLSAARKPEPEDHETPNQAPPADQTHPFPDSPFPRFALFADPPFLRKYSIPGKRAGLGARRTWGTRESGVSLAWTGKILAAVEIWVETKSGVEGTLR